MTYRVSGEKRGNMNYLEIFNIEKELLEKVINAIKESRDFTEIEQKYYDAYIAMQELRKYLVDKI